MPRTPALRSLPQIHAVLELPVVKALCEQHGRGLVLALLRERLEALRSALRGAGGARTIGADVEALPRWLEAEAARRTRPSLTPLLNATGVVLHTNLGRAPLPEAAIRRIEEVAGSYCNLEFDLGRGGRGSRGAHLDRLLPLLFPGRAALVVNNNAAAVLLALNTLAEGKEVVVSRGELVEIGGSFRIPEILAKSGAFLREVGTTNKTRLGDYERALSKRTGLLLKVHPSNYRITGFTAEVGLADLARLARRRRVPLVLDQGSGNTVDLRPFGVRGEPVVGGALEEGADLVSFSGDKLFGGPQAGLLVGRPALVERLRRNPLARALRADKTILAALEAVILLHLRGRYSDIPVQRMIALDRDTLERRARAFAERVLRRAPAGLSLKVVPGTSMSGGGSAPEEGLPTALVEVRAASLKAAVLLKRLRDRPLPVIARIAADALVLDLRTVAEGEEGELERALLEADLRR
jgi:L-seryl-tRNA(Ser) seleniumtransferase